MESPVSDDRAGRPAQGVSPCSASLRSGSGDCIGTIEEKDRNLLIRIQPDIYCAVNTVGRFIPVNLSRCNCHTIALVGAESGTELVRASAPGAGGKPQHAHRILAVDRDAPPDRPASSARGAGFHSSGTRLPTSRPQPYLVSVFDKPHWLTALATKDKAKAYAMEQAMVQGA